MPTVRIAISTITSEAPRFFWEPPWTNRLISLPSMLVCGEAEIRSLV